MPDYMRMVGDVLHLDYPCPYGCSTVFSTPQLGGYGSDVASWPEEVREAAARYDRVRREHFDAEHPLTASELRAGVAFRHGFGGAAAGRTAAELWHSGVYMATGGSWFVRHTADQMDRMKAHGRERMNIARALDPTGLFHHDTEETP